MSVSVYLTHNLTVLATLPFTDNFPPLTFGLVKGTTCLTHIYANSIFIADFSLTSPVNRLHTDGHSSYYETGSCSRMVHFFYFGVFCLTLFFR